jgi:hypothetical protein
MCVCVFLCCVVLCVCRGLALDWSPNQGVLPNVCGSRNPLRKAKVRRDCRSQLKKITYFYTYSPCVSIHPHYRSGSFIMPFQKFLWLLFPSSLHKSFDFIVVLNLLPPRASLSGPKWWKSHGAKSDYRRGVAVPPNAFPPMFLLSQRRYADVRCLGSDRHLLTDGTCHFERKAGFTWSLRSFK